MRRFPVVPASPSSGGGLVIVMPPAAVIPAVSDCPECPGVSPLDQWRDITTVLSARAVSPAGASLSSGLFLATPGDDTTSTYVWELDTAGLAVPNLCRVVYMSDVAAHDNFRYTSAGSSSIQDGTGEIISPYFMLRPGDGDTAQISAYQRNTSFGDSSNGLLGPVSFRVLCIAVDPS